MTLRRDALNGAAEVILAVERLSKSVSGAGHDSMHLATTCPAGMLLAPSVGGISHRSSEWTELDYIVAGTLDLVDATVQILMDGVTPS